MPGPDVPKGDGRRTSPRRSRGSSGGSRPAGSKPAAHNVDEEVVSLREKGTSYAAVAKALGIKRAAEAHAAFLRVLRASPEDERLAMTERESQRLDRLEKRVRSRDAAEPAKLQRHLAALEQLRQSLV